VGWVLGVVDENDYALLPPRARLTSPTCLSLSLPF